MQREFGCLLHWKLKLLKPFVSADAGLYPDAITVLPGTVVFSRACSNTTPIRDTWQTMDNNGCATKLFVMRKLEKSMFQVSTISVVQEVGKSGQSRLPKSFLYQKKTCIQPPMK